jgi:hypothetical protein
MVTLLPGGGHVVNAPMPRNARGVALSRTLIVERLNLLGPSRLGGKQRAGVVVPSGLGSRDQVSTPIGKLGEVLAQVGRDLIAAAAGAEFSGKEGRELLARRGVDVAHKRPGVFARPLLQVFVVGLPGVGLDARGRELQRAGAGENLRERQRDGLDSLGQQRAGVTPGGDDALGRVVGLIVFGEGQVGLGNVRGEVLVLGGQQFLVEATHQPRLGQHGAVGVVLGLG